jgi:hypothetical protein
MFINNLGITFPNGSFQDRKAPRMYVNADFDSGLVTDADLFPGDYYFDEATGSIYIIYYDNSFGQNAYLDLTVRTPPDSPPPGT